MSVKETKRLLGEDQSKHNFKNAMLLEKIKEVRQSLTEKHNTIQKKTL